MNHMHAAATADVGFGGSLVGGVELALGTRVSNRYEVECLRPVTRIPHRLAAWFGASDALLERIDSIVPKRLVWRDTIENLVVNEGLDDLLDKYLKGSSYTASFFVGLTDDSPTVAAGDTMSSHAGWAEATGYSESVRQTLTLGTVSSQSVDNSASKASFSINATDTIGGAFITTNSTKSGTTGTLYGVGAFTGGSPDKAVADGDTLNVTVTATSAAS